MLLSCIHPVSVVTLFSISSTNAYEQGKYSEMATNTLMHSNSGAGFRIIFIYSLTLCIFFVCLHCLQWISLKGLYWKKWVTKSTFEAFLMVTKELGTGLGRMLKRNIYSIWAGSLEYAWSLTHITDHYMVKLSLNCQIHFHPSLVLHFVLRVHRNTFSLIAITLV